MLEEGIAAFQNLATEKVSTFNGKYYSFRALELAPKPLQRPFRLFIGRA